MFNSSSGVSRRTVSKGAAWSVPVVATAVASPAFAASVACEQKALAFNHDETTNPLPYIHGKGVEFPSDVQILVSENGVPATSGTVLVTLEGDATFAGGSTTASVPVGSTGLALIGTTASGFPITTKSVLTSTGIQHDFSDDVKNFKITAQLEGCSSATAEQEWVYPNLVSWGSNGNNALGDGTTTTRYSPGAIGPYKVWSSNLSAFQGHAFAITEDNDLWGWGRNSSGQVGVGSTTDQPVPVQITGKWTKAEPGALFTLGIRSDTGNTGLWSWGEGGQGQLGLGTTTDRTTPQLVRSWGILSESGGGSHSTFVRSNGTLFGFGQNIYGQVGRGDTDSPVTSPVQIATSNSNFASVSNGRNHSTALSNTGYAFTWGRNEYGQLGKGTSGTTVYRVPSSTSVNGTVLFKKLNTHYDHNLAIDTNDDLYVWGSNQNHDTGTLAGQLGDGTSVLQRTNPIAVSTPGLKWSEVQAGSIHSLAITTDGDLYGWGITNLIGNGSSSTTPQLSPQKVGHMKWDAIACGSAASYGVARTFVPKGYAY
ncbi:MAG: hypothetical protein QM632_01350 [Micrococcaceae bacterium]